MSKLPKEKRDRLILVGAISLLIVGALWTMVVSDQRETIAKQEERTARVREKIANANRLLNMRVTIQTKYDERVQLLADKEAEMAPEEDPYAWMCDKIYAFKEGRQLENVSVTRVASDIKPVGLLPAFAYKAVEFHLTGRGFYSTIGRFVADLENEFKLFQIRNISITPEPKPTTAPGGEDQTLRVEFDIVALVKPSTGTPSK